MSVADRAALPPTRLPASAAFTDAIVIARRNLLTIIRTPQLLVFSTIQPVMFVLLFRYVFGGAINVPTESYASFLLPGVFVQTVVFGSTTAAVALAYDLKGGMIDRFRSLPMARSAVLAGRTAADAVRNLFVIMLMVAVGYAVDFRFQGGFLSAIGAMAIALLFGYAFSWFFALMGMVASSPESAQSVGFLAIFPLTFASSAFVPTESMPDWLQAFADINPFTIVVNAVRALWLDAPADNYIWGAFAWTIGMILVFAPLAVRAYRRAAVRA